MRGRGLGASQFNELMLYLGYERAQVAVSTRYGAYAKVLIGSGKSPCYFMGMFALSSKRLAHDVGELEELLVSFEPTRAKKPFRERHQQILPPDPIPGVETGNTWDI